MTIDTSAFLNQYPFPSHYFEASSGCQIHFVDEGAGECLLFVHGNPTWSFAWRRLIGALRGSYRTIAIDHAGCGLSDKPVGYRYCLDQHICNLCELIDALVLKDITVVAHDWGGAIAMGAAARRPDLFRRFVLMNTAAFRSQSIPFRIAVCRWPFLGTLALRGLNAFSRAAIYMAVEKPERMTKEVRAGYLAPYNSWANRIGVQHFVNDIPLNESHPSYDTLKKVEEGLCQFQQHPMLLPWGVRDWCFTTEFLDEFVRRFPQAEVFRLDEAGHYVFEDAYELLIPRIKKFLADHPLNATGSADVVQRSTAK